MNQSRRMPGFDGPETTGRRATDQVAAQVTVEAAYAAVWNAWNRYGTAYDAGVRRVSLLLFR